MRLHHLALRTHDLSSLEAFYVDVFALRVARRDGERSVWLPLGPGAVLMLELATDDEPRPNPESLDLVAFACASSDERDAVEQRLAARQVVIEARTAHTLYFRDPDGRRVGVSTYPL